MNYVICSDSQVDKLEKKVQSLIFTGWKPLGGVVVCCDVGQARNQGDYHIETTVTFHQAMIHE